jgi:hypothetical protein
MERKRHSAALDKLKRARDRANAMVDLDPPQNRPESIDIDFSGAPAEQILRLAKEQWVVKWTLIVIMWFYLGWTYTKIISILGVANKTIADVILPIQAGKGFTRGTTKARAPTDKRIQTMRAIIANNKPSTWSHW